MKKIFITIGRIILNAIYAILKKCKTRNKVVMISRQSNEISIDFDLLKREFEQRGIEVKVCCKKISKGFMNKIEYCVHMLESMYHLATSKYCIVDTYCIPVSILEHKEDLKIMQIWHALGAVKKFGHQVLDKEEGRNKQLSHLLKMHSNYTYITCASSATKASFAKAFNVAVKKIKVLGVPRIDYILEQQEVGQTALLNEYPKLKEKQTILYVPTFRKKRNVRIQELISSIDLEKYNLVIRLHPLDTNLVLEEYAVDQKFNTYQLLQVADYIITDYSAVAIEASLTNKPLYFWIYDIKKYKKTRGLNINLQKEMTNSTNCDIKDIIKKIEANDYDFQELKRFREKYVETIDKNNTKRIVDFMVEGEATYARTKKEIEGVFG